MFGVRVTIIKHHNNIFSYTLRCHQHHFLVERKPPHFYSSTSYSISSSSMLSLVPSPVALSDAWKCFVAVAITFVAGFFFATKPLPIPSSLPGPKQYPYIGYLPHVLQHWHEWPTETTRLAKKYKRTWGGPLPNFGGLPGAYFYISHEENLQHILKTNFDNYGKGDMWTRVLGELLGKGIFAVDGDRWKMHRKLMSNMFSRNLLRHSAAIFRTKIIEVLKTFEKGAAAADAAQVEEGNLGNGFFKVDLQDVFFRLTLDSMSIVSFDVDLHSVENEKQHEFALAFDELSNLCQKRFLDPLFQLKRFFRLSWRENRIRVLKKVVDGFAYKVIASKRRSADEGSPLGPDLLSRFIDHARTTDEEISDSDLRDVIMNVLLAGRDTTACALSWTFYELTRNPDVVQKITEEVESVCGVGDQAEYTYDTMAKLRYTHCVALEVLRLHPSVTNDPRYAVQDDLLPDGTRIPAGAGFDLCFYTMLRKEETWGDDALQFKPERFLNEKETSPFKYPVFHAGPRTCLGKPLALMNMKLAMSIMLTSEFKIMDRIGHTGEYLWTLVESMKDGFEVQIIPVQPHR